MVVLLRVILLFFIVFLLSLALKFLFTSNRKIKIAQKQKRFMLLDSEDVRRNFQLTFKGALFSGEKYMGAAENTFDVVSITVSPNDPSDLKGLMKEDFYFIDKKIQEKYPKAEIYWNSPVKEFLQKN